LRRCERRWSPEQISHALCCEFPGNPGRHAVHETVYRAVYRTELGGLRRDLPGVLRTGRRRRKPRHRPDPRRPGSLAGMTMIDQRPAEVTERRVPGRWESQWCCQAA
jgi:IS30 family transposase